MGNSKEYNSPYIAWCDCEMTGLNIVRDELIEVAFLVTDYNLNIQDEGFDIVIKPSDSALNNMDDFVKKMHTKNGLLAELDQGKTVSEVDQVTIEYLQQFETQSRSLLLAGNSISSDRKFINKQMPLTDKFLHYRLIDVSTIKELSKRWYPTVKQYGKGSSHRALDDIKESIGELKFYKEKVFV
jgi:oligoribonuclease